MAKLGPRHKPTKAQLAQVEHELAATSHAVAALPYGVIQDLAPVLAQAERETVAGLRAWLQTVPNGNVRYTAQQRRNTLLHLRRAFEAIERMHPALLASLQRVGRLAGEMSVRNLTNEVARFSTMFEGSTTRIQLNLGRILAQGERTLIPRYDSSARRYAGNVRRDIERELAVGVIRGETVFELTNRLQRMGGPRGNVALVDTPRAVVTENIPEGLFTRYRYWASRVARTEVINAYNEQLDEGLHEARHFIPDIRRRWDASADSRLCDICAGLAGEVRKLDEPFADGIDNAPAHSNCRCRCGAWRDDWSSILEEAGVEDRISPQALRGEVEREMQRRAEED